MTSVLIFLSPLIEKVRLREDIMMRFKKWFLVFVLCLISIVVYADNQDEVESPSSQAASFQAIVEKAERGDAEAQNDLGLMYLNGEGVTQNDVEAAKWFRKAAEQGQADAQVNLGWMYNYGKGVTKNDSEAIKWHRKAAEQGYAQAQFILGARYSLGKGVAQNGVEAAKWFLKAAEQGHADASEILGRILITQGKFDEARSVTEKAYQMEPQNVSLITNLGHTYLLKGEHQTARRYYQEALPLIPDDASFEKGPIADFELFIEKGWQVKVCQSELEWIRAAYEPFKLANTYYGQMFQYYQQGLFKEALPLAEKAWNLRKKILGEKHPSTLTSLNYLALIHRELGHLTEALPLLEKGYRLSKEVLGEKHPDTFNILNNLAIIYINLGHFTEALPLLEKAYRLFSEVLGKKHSATVLSLNSLAMTLAMIHKELGRLTEALPLLEKGYSLSKEVLGEKHPDTVRSFNFLAAIHRELGHLTKALPLSEKGYRLLKEVLGEKHPDTLSSMINLAMVYKDLGRFSEALPLAESGFSLRKEVLGEKHPDTLASMMTLAMIYNYLGILSEALPLAESGYRLSKEVLGEKHPDTLRSLGNLALIYKDLGRLTEALPLLEKAYRLSLKVLGEKHSSTITSINNLAFIYQLLGNLSEALLLFEKGYRLRKEMLGEKHPDTLNSMNNLAGIYRDLGRFSEVLPLHEKCYHLTKEVLGEKHPDTLISLNNLAISHQDLGHLTEALPLSEKNYRLFSEVLGEKHPDTLMILNNFSQIYRDLGRFSEALPLSEKAYRLRKEVLGEKHPDTLISLNNLAIIHQNLGHLTEASPLFESAFSLFKEVLGEKHPTTLLSLGNLAYNTYLKQGQIDEAIKHYEKFVKGVETLRSGDLSAENRQALFKTRVPGYFQLSYLYAAQSRFVKAFHLAEMSKARTLLESLAAKLAAQQSGLTTAEQQQLQDYNTRLAFLNNRIGKAREENRLEEKITLETEKNQLVIQLSQFQRELRAKYPKYAQVSKVETIGAKEGAKYLPADAVLISYLVNEKDVLAFTLQSDGVLTAHYLGETPNLKKDLETYRRLLFLGIQVQEQSPNKPIWLKKRPTTIQSLSRQFGKQLLEPLKDIIKDKPHWIISPSGALALIPFETLRLEGENQPVITQHQISYVQSLSVLKLLQERDKVYNGLNVKNLENRGTLLAMGAPLYESTATNKGNPSTTDYKIADHLVMRGGDYARAFRQLGRGGDYWKNLPGAERELKQLEELFKETKPRIYKQADATEAKLQELNQQGILAQYRYLVFSAHGYLSPQVPALSSIVLGQVNNPPEIDGYVTAGEWPGYDLKSDLMVLSACETGVGSVVGGEGVMGLPYAFYVAGNKNTILTLWEISDNITTEFTTSFFAKLKAGVGQIEALTETKREFLKKGGIYSNPKYWAAFVLYGV
jgi:CHAT domain-containing protein/Flp pilus assembly protein TadD